MDQKYFNAIISEMQVLLDGQKFSEVDGIFKNNQKAVKIEYNQPSKQFVLLVADVAEDGSVGEFVAANSWLFDETQTERDASAVGIDFSDTLREQLGLKKSKTTTANIDLPVAEKSDAGTVSALTQKLLAVFPQLKETYKASVQANNKFLYLNFYAENFVPAVKQLLQTGTKKQIKKLFDLLSEFYNTGNSEVSDVIVALISAVTFGNDEILNTVNEHIAENQHLKTALKEFSSILAKNKKLQEALIK